MRSLVLLFSALGGASATAVAATAPDVVTLSIVATTDLHGNIAPRNDLGGLAMFGGYLRNLRAARAADGGAVLVVDSGDTFQGGIESDLSEGAVVVDAYAALGYAAAVIGNHEFDFGAADRAGARQPRGGDPRGALQARAAQAPFPLLAANLLDETTGERVAWPNVHASTLVTAAGVKVGIVGVMTSEAVRATLRANVHGLRVAPLAATVAAEAAKLRSEGAEVVIVGAHAGGACGELGDPTDLSSCDPGSEIFALAQSLPRGLVDVIAAGHTHQAVAHEVAGIAIVQAYALGRAFGRVDVAFDRRTQRVAGHEIFAPQDICAAAGCGAQSSAEAPRRPARYEGRVVAPDPAIDAAMAPALARVRALQATALGVVLDTPIERRGTPESPLGNLFADAERKRAGADVAINNNVRGGLRADLPAGALTFGALYDVFPFDNRLVTLTITGAELRALLVDEVRRDRRGALGLSGIRVRVSCSTAGELDVEVARDNGAPLDADDPLGADEPLGAEERVVVAAMDSLVLGQVFAAVPAAGGISVPADTPVLREVVEDWLRARGGHLAANELLQPERPRWQYVDDLTACLRR